MNQTERREGPTSHLSAELLEDRNAATGFGWWSFGGGWPADHPPTPAHGHHWTPSSHSHGWGRGGCGGHHQPPSPPAQTGSVTGVLFLDGNFDGTRDPDESGLGGQVVWADANGNGALDAGEVSTTTAADGSYTLAGLPANTTLVVSAVVDNGAAYTPVTVSLQAGETLNGVDVAVRPGTSS